MNSSWFIPGNFRAIAIVGGVGLQLASDGIVRASDRVGIAWVDAVVDAFQRIVDLCVGRETQLDARVGVVVLGVREGSAAEVHVSGARLDRSARP